eukprot:COSAG02_NODE_520_length_20751_cov_17.817112_11_plen_154_part_00
MLYCTVLVRCTMNTTTTGTDSTVRYGTVVRLSVAVTEQCENARPPARRRSLIGRWKRTAWVLDSGNFILSEDLLWAGFRRVSRVRWGQAAEAINLKKSISQKIDLRFLDCLSRPCLECPPMSLPCRCCGDHRPVWLDESPTRDGRAGDAMAAR